MTTNFNSCGGFKTLNKNAPQPNKIFMEFPLFVLDQCVRVCKIL